MVNINALLCTLRIRKSSVPSQICALECPAQCVRVCVCKTVLYVCVRQRAHTGRARALVHRVQGRSVFGAESKRSAVNGEEAKLATAA
jgi:hypothetical protein